jgi:hypothetical protein
MSSLIQKVMEGLNLKHDVWVCMLYVSKPHQHHNQDCLLQAKTRNITTYITIKVTTMLLKYVKTLQLQEEDNEG